MRIPTLLAAIPLGAAALAPAQANDNPYRYAAAGIEAPAYVYSATANGPMSAWYMGSTAGYNETLGVKVNGKTIASGIFPNHATDNFVRYDFGDVKAGDALEFFIDVLTTGDVFSSDKAKNRDSLTHVFASAHPAEPWIGVPAGTFIGFEDLMGGGDLNYNDHTFVFSNVSFALPSASGGTEIGGAVPEPATWGMMVLGFGAVGMAARRRRSPALATA